MAEPLSDTVNPALSVDEMKRKARRRLVGAVVIALAAAIVLPLLLESDPKPLGEDVSVRIPAIDDGRFVNRLSGKAADSPVDSGKAPPVTPSAKAAVAAQAGTTAAPVVADTIAAPAAATPAASAPKRTVAEAEQRLLAPAPKAASVAPAEEKPPAPAPAAMVPVPEPQSAAPAPKAPGVPGATPSAPETYVVQLVAYADDKGANALAGRLKKAGHKAYVEPVVTSRGTLWRVRVGVFATRAEADAARTKLKSEGHNGIVAKAT